MYAAGSGNAPAEDTSFFGHPRGLATLFLTEMWERFSYYGMRALLVLFMTAPVAAGGLGFEADKAGAIYGLYTAAVYLLALPGGFLADRLFGQQRSILYGGIVIAAGHFSMAIPGMTTFYLGLVLIVLGTGLLKPNISAIVGELYPEGGARRDAGFSIFYMGINLGALIAPFACGYLGEEIDWHLGFGAAGVGMVIALIQYVYGLKHLGSAGKLQPSDLPAGEEARRRRHISMGLGMFLGGLAFLGALLATGMLAIDVVDVASGATVVIVSAAVIFFIAIFSAGKLERVEKKRVGAVAVLFLFSAMFWMGFEQSGSSMNIFARDLTDRVVAGWEMPASFLQAANPLFIILLAPVFAALWVGLLRWMTIPLKFALGLVLLGLGFLVLVFGAQAAAGGAEVSPAWLLGAFFLHTCGELCISPVGLSSTTKLAPKRYKSQMMGVWFISMSLGNLLAGLVAGRIESLPIADVFFWVFVTTAGAGVVMLVLVPLVNRLAAGVK